MPVLRGADLRSGWRKTSFGNVPEVAAFQLFAPPI
jgi:hypothetical protein